MSIFFHLSGVNQFLLYITRAGSESEIAH